MKQNRLLVYLIAALVSVGVPGTVGAAAPSSALANTTPTSPTLPPNPVESTISVASVDVAIQRGYARATISVVDGDGNPVSGVRVKGYWSEGARGSGRAKTNDEGSATTRRAWLSRFSWFGHHRRYCDDDSYGYYRSDSRRRSGRGHHDHDYCRPVETYPPNPADALMPTFTVTRVVAPDGYEWDGIEVSASATPVSVTASVEVKQRRKRYTAVVHIIDANGNPVPGAVLVGEWSGGADGRSFAVSNSRGNARTRRVRGSGDDAAFTITQLVLPPGYVMVSYPPAP